jgi:hypothetical protein
MVAAVIGFYAASFACSAIGASLPLESSCISTPTANHLAFLAVVLGAIGLLGAFIGTLVGTGKRALFGLLLCASVFTFYAALRVTLFPGSSCHPFY